jgi:hypothetical protein
VSNGRKPPKQRKPGQKGGHGGQEENRITHAAGKAYEGEKGKKKSDSCAVIGLTGLGILTGAAGSVSGWF